MIKIPKLIMLIIKIKLIKINIITFRIIKSITKLLWVYQRQLLVQKKRICIRHKIKIFEKLDLKNLKLSKILLHHKRI